MIKTDKYQMKSTREKKQKEKDRKNTIIEIYQKATNFDVYDNHLYNFFLNVKFVEYN